MDLNSQKMMAELQRQDGDIPLKGFSLPVLDKLRQKYELPDQFLRACTLREGTWVVVLTLNCVAAMVISFLALLLIEYPKETTDWWKERFRDDFDTYYKDENQDLINWLYPKWVPISYVIIGCKAAYIVTGFVVFWALFKKTVHPCWYMPWMLMTGMFVTVMWLMAGVMIICVFILLTYRPITVTWDICPICFLIAYNVGWSYCWFVVIAHYKRRCIVKYWRDRQVKIGADALGPRGY